MIEKEIDIKTKDGLMNTFVTHPEEDSPFPVILFLMDAPGKREELHDMARRLGTSGYFVMVPNLYYRKTRNFIFEATESGRVKMFDQMDSLTNDMAVKDCRELLAHADSDENAKKGKAGCVGYCMSGPFAFSAAAALNDRIKASASFHGVKLLTDQTDSPHLNADKIDGEIYFGMAEKDRWASPEMVSDLDASLSRTGINYRIEWYADTEHGFVFPNRGAIYKKQAAEKHYERLISLFNRNLKRESL